MARVERNELRGHQQITPNSAALTLAHLTLFSILSRARLGGWAARCHLNLLDPLDPAGRCGGSRPRIRRLGWPAAPLPVRFSDFDSGPRSQTIEPGKHQAINVAESHSLGRSAMQHIELVSKEQDLRMQRSPRPE
jgi:hypothetical protein